MHPDMTRLAAYLDGALAPDERAELRAHILTCAACAARVERMRADARRIAGTLSSAAAAVDVRADVRSRLRRPTPLAWLGRGLAFAGALAALLLFALMIGVGSRATAGRIPDRLFVTDATNGRLIVLNADDGAVLGQVQLGEGATSIRYDRSRDQLYAMLKQSIVVVDPHTLEISARWAAPRPFDSATGMALDGRRGRLYVAQPGTVTALALDTPQMEIVGTYDLGMVVNALALAPDARTLFALDQAQGRLATIDVASGRATFQTLAPASAIRFGWLAASRDGQFVYVLLTRAGRGDQNVLWRIDRDGAAEAPRVLETLPLPWDLELLDSGQLAIPRGDGQRGGVELVDADTLATVARLDLDRDQHHVVVGPGGALFGLNFTHNSVTRFDARNQAVVWRTPERASWQPWDGVYVPGGWRWPF